MQKNSFSQRAISVLLSILMVISAVPVFVISSVAEVSATLPLEVSGSWSHKAESGDKGINYTSMGVVNTDFLFMQTEANQKFKFSFEFWAFKNDGANWSRIDSLTFSGIELDSVNWTPKTSNAGSTPNGQELPGTFGTGYDSQKKNNIVKWQGDFEFTGKGSHVYNAKIDVAYTSGSTSSNKSAQSLSNDDDLVPITITVVDLRRINNLVTKAEYAYANDTTLTDDERAELGEKIAYVRTFTLDGTVPYTQDQIDELCQLFGDPVTLDPVSGEWEHQTVPEGQQYEGYGEEYVSMWVKNTDFVFMQTEDNQEISFDFEYWAMKNNGVNTAIINTATFDGMNLDSYTWTGLNSNTVGTTPNGYGLPGIIGSGYTQQYVNNLAKWNFTGTFTAQGRAVYNPYLDVNYKSGSTGYNTSTNSFYSYNEIVDFTITVVDMRELLAKMATAKDICENGNGYSTEEIANIQAIVDDIEETYTLDGSVCYTQAEIDSLAARLDVATGADFTEYKKALERAENVVSSSQYTRDQKDVILNLDSYKNKDTILTMNAQQQDEIDAATAELLAALNSIDASMNGLSGNPEGAGVFTFNSSKGTSDGVTITISSADVYMDVTEKFSDLGLTVSYATNFATGTAYSFYTAAPVANSLATGSKIAGNANLYNFNQKIVYNTAQSSSEDQVPNGNGTYKYYTEYSLALGNKPSIAPSNGNTAVERVYIGCYWRQHKNNTAFIGNNSYDYYSNDGGIFSDSQGRSAADSQPYFTLHVYDKSGLKAAIDAACAAEKNGAFNFDACKTLIAQAKTIYGTRAVEQSDIDAAAAALNDFLFEFLVTVTPEDTIKGNTTATFVSGTAKGSNVYTKGSVLEIEAIPTGDYEFKNWSDGSKEAVREYTVTGNANLVAYFDFVTANTSKLENLLADVPVIATENEYKYDSDTLDALAQAVADAEAIVNAEPALGKSHQDEVDAAEQALRDAIDGLDKVIGDPCDYQLLDDVIDAAEALIETLPDETNDGRYKNAAWEAFEEALADARNVDRDLTDEDPANQQLIVDKALALAEALSDLGEPKNQNGKVDTTELEQAKTEAENAIGAENDGRYKNDDWQEYLDALADAEEIIKNPPYDDDDGVHQQEVDDAKQRIDDILAVLQDEDNWNGKVDTTKLKEAKDEAEDKYGEENNGKYHDDVWQDYIDALEKAEELINNPKYDDDDGVNQKEVDDAKQALEDAIAALEDPDNQNGKVDTTELKEAKDDAEDTYGEENNGKYKDDVWQDYIDALEEAKDLIENPPYDDDKGVNQQKVDDAKQALDDAMTALEDPANQNGKVDTTELKEVKDDAEATYGETNTGRYKDDVWQDYIDALEEAKDLIENPPYDDDKGVNQQKVDDAKQALEDAMAALEDPDNQNYLVTVKDEEGDVIAVVPVTKDPETTIGEIKDELPDVIDGIYEVVGWKDEEDNEISDDTPVTEDMVIVPIVETNYFILKEDATATFEEDSAVKYVGTVYEVRKVSEVKSQFRGNISAYVVDRNGVELSDTSKVKTGDIIKYVDTETGDVLDEAIIVLYGDINGDGAIDAFDVIELDLNMNGVNPLEGAYLKAADAVVHNGVINTDDYRYIEKFARGC